VIPRLHSLYNVNVILIRAGPIVAASLSERPLFYTMRSPN